MFFGLVLAVALALGTNAAFLLKAQGALAAPPVRIRHPLRSAVGLFRSRWFAIGWLVAIVAWLLHVGALAFAPLSITQAVLSGGLVFLAVLAERFFGFRLQRRQWIGITVTAIGLTGTGSRRPEHASLAALISVECSIFALVAVLVSVSMHRHIRRTAAEQHKPRNANRLVTPRRTAPSRQTPQRDTPCKRPVIPS